MRPDARGSRQRGRIPGVARKAAGPWRHHGTERRRAAPPSGAGGLRPAGARRPVARGGPGADCRLRRQRESASHLYISVHHQSSGTGANVWHGKPERRLPVSGRRAALGEHRHRNAYGDDQGKHDREPSLQQHSLQADQPGFPGIRPEHVHGAAGRHSPTPHLLLHRGAIKPWQRSVLVQNSEHRRHGRRGRGRLGYHFSLSDGTFERHVVGRGPQFCVHGPDQGRGAAAAAADPRQQPRKRGCRSYYHCVQPPERVPAVLDGERGGRLYARWHSSALRWLRRHRQRGAYGNAQSGRRGQQARQTAAHADQSIHREPCGIERVHGARGRRSRSRHPIPRRAGKFVREPSVVAGAVRCGPRLRSRLENSRTPFPAK